MLAFIRMKQISSSEANSRSAGQDIQRSLRNPKVDYRARNRPLLIPILPKMIPIHMVITYFIWDPL
jgi:hypothetical protein